MSGRFGDVMLMSHAYVVWPDMVWKNDRNVGKRKFKLYRHCWLLVSTNYKRPSSDEVELNHPFY